jgi:hypothetical protein
MRFSQRLYVIICTGIGLGRRRAVAGRQARALPITSSRMGCLLDSLDRGYRVLGI